MLGGEVKQNFTALLHVRVFMDSGIHHFLKAAGDLQPGGVALVGGAFDGATDGVCPLLLRSLDILGADGQNAGIPLGQFPGGFCRDLEGVGTAADQAHLPFRSGGRAVEKGGKAHKVRDKGRSRPVKNLLGLADLQNVSGVHNDDPVRQGDGLLVVVGHDDGGDAQLFLDALDLHLHLHPELGVQVGKGLVQQQDGGTGHQGTSQGHTLLLAAGELPGITLVHTGELYQGEHVLHPLPDLLLGQLLELQTKGHVFKNRHVGEQRVILEENADIAAVGRDGGHIFAVHQDLPGSGLGEAGDHAQCGGLAAAAAAQQGDHLAFGSLQVHGIHRSELAESLGQSL